MNLEPTIKYPEPSHHHKMQNVSVVVNNISEAVNKGTDIVKDAIDIVDNGIHIIKDAQLDYMKSYGENVRNYKKPEEIIDMLAKASKNGIPYITVKSTELKPKTIEYLIKKGARFMEADPEDIRKTYGTEKNSNCFCQDAKLSGINAVNISFSLI